MQQSLFSKYFSVCSAIILAAIAFLGTIFMMLVAQYFKSDKFELLNRNLRQAANLTVTNYQSNLYSGVDQKIILPYYQILGNAIDADIYLTDLEGNTLICSHGSNCNHLSNQISQQIITEALKGDFEEVSNMGGIYNSRYYCAAIPVEAGGVKVGVLFGSIAADAFNSFITEMMQMFLLSALLVLLVSFVVIYFVTNRLVRPLREMVDATQSFINGDFTIRIPVEGYTEIDRLGMAFNNMASSLGAMESTRRSFVANVSHELKTPMTTIGGFIDGILDGTVPEEKRDYYLGVVSEEVKRLSRLVRSMLEMARIEAGETTLHRKEFDINETVITTVFTFEQAIDGKHLDVRGLDHGKVMVDADPDLIHQVVYNLVDNAVKFVNDGGYLEFSYVVEGDITYIGVKNSGAGIPKDEISHVFDRFYKTDKSRSLDKNGVGLGLHIVRSIVNLHSGDIIVSSVEGEYCQFVFSLPSASKNARKNDKFKDGSRPSPRTT
ncbi:MAG: HAMP domain-containing histidine kinase [Oscillospiraceae bacterium]|nr:HAMP domain-containing histidine kinase [Oscillospiraceae bacterium]